MTTREQCCGTCAYYTPSTDEMSSHGTCGWDAIPALPEAVTLEVSRWTRSPYNGRTCLCWEWRGEVDG